MGGSARDAAKRHTVIESHSRGANVRTDATSDKNDINLTAVETPRRPRRTFLGVSCMRYRSHGSTKTRNDSFAGYPPDSSVRLLEAQQGAGWDPSMATRVLAVSDDANA